MSLLRQLVGVFICIVLSAASPVKGVRMSRAASSFSAGDVNQIVNTHNALRIRQNASDMGFMDRNVEWMCEKLGSSVGRITRLYRAAVADDTVTLIQWNKL
ncbi:hypothetical protein LSAT2_010342, partial [Lamellibrachia satsuma]